MKYGTDHPSQIDLIGLKDGVCRFTIVQVERLNDERVLLLQEKLNNYLTYILDGQLAEEYPDRAELPKVVEVALQFPPEGVAIEFLSKVGEVFREKGIGFEHVVKGT
jgi:hypothetical protein